MFFILFSVFDDRKLRHPISYTNPPPLCPLHCLKPVYYLVPVRLIADVAIFAEKFGGDEREIIAEQTSKKNMPDDQEFYHKKIEYVLLI